MNRRIVSTVLCVLAAAHVAGFGVNSPTLEAAAKDKPKVILLGLDGADPDLTREMIEAGHLPNLKRLAEEGTFAPLGTSNPAQSPVSWAVLETASNPGKTNIPDFVRRKLLASGPFPEPTGTDTKVVTAEELGDYVPLSSGEKILYSLHTAKGKALLGAGAFVIFILMFLACRAVLHLPAIVAGVIGVVFASAFGFLGVRMIGEIPTKFPISVSQMKGTRFWEVLDKNGIRFAGLQVPAAFPCVTEFANSRILGGLFTPDVAGGTGSWYIYTNDEWASSNSSTNSGGTTLKVYPDTDAVIRDELRGPTNFYVDQGYTDRIDAVREQLKSDKLSSGDRADLEETERQLVSEHRRFNQDRKVKAPLEIRPNYAAKTLEITIDGVSQSLKEGDWSEFFRVTFPITRLVKVHALTRFYVEKCHVDSEGFEQLRMFVPPIAISPEEQPAHLPISTPRRYAAEIANDIGLYDTLGWACWTNAVKDEELPEEAFLQGLEFTQNRRSAQLYRELDRDDWDVLFHVESTTDRACHMLYRFIDPEHPQYNDVDRDGNLLRDRMVTAYGRTFPLKDGILETFKEADLIVGEVLKRMDAGKYGDNVHLMVVSDHGFEPFRWGVELNTWLARNGYLALKGQENFMPGELNEIPDGAGGKFFDYVDWTRTTAYSMGLGKVYISLKGREPFGIVEPGDYDRLRAEIIEKLESFVDPSNGRKVVVKAYDGQEIYEGPYKDEPGDIVLGFASGYRVSWSTSTGGFAAKDAAQFGIGDNPEPWSGDHVGVDPSLVNGIFFSNRKLVGGFEPNLINIAPAILNIFGLKRPSDWDGTSFDLE